VLPLLLAISLKLGITRNPKHLLAGTSLGFDYMKKSKYISEDERGGFNVAKVNLPPSDGRLRLFLEGKEDWLEEGLLVPVKKNLKRKDYKRRFFHGPRRRCTTKLCPTIWRNPGAAKLLRWCTNASMGEWCSHAQRGAICTPSSTTTKCGHHWRIRCEEHANYCSHPKLMQTKWVKEMQTSLISFDAFT
jgi:hypothetical protein